jgi:hypothetical protein
MPQLSQKHPFSTTVPNERYSRMLKGVFECCHCVWRHLPSLFLEVDHCRKPQVGGLCKIGLRDVQQGTRGFALRRGHFNNFY